MDWISPGRNACFTLVDSIKDANVSMDGSSTGLVQLLYTISSNSSVTRVERCICELSDLLEELCESEVGVLETEHAHDVILEGMTKHPTSRTIQKHGLFVLSRLVDVSEKLRSELESREVHCLILEVMSKFTQDMCIPALGCKLIANLAVADRVRKDLIFRNAIDVVLQVVKRFSEEEELQLSALEALSQLLTDEPQQQEFVNKGNHEVVAKVMKDFMFAGMHVRISCSSTYCQYILFSEG